VLSPPPIPFLASPHYILAIIQLLHLKASPLPLAQRDGIGPPWLRNFPPRNPRQVLRLSHFPMIDQVLLDSPTPVLVVPPLACDKRCPDVYKKISCFFILPGRQRSIHLNPIFSVFLVRQSQPLRQPVRAGASKLLPLRIFPRPLFFLVSPETPPLLIPEWTPVEKSSWSPLPSICYDYEQFYAWAFSNLLNSYWVFENAPPPFNGLQLNARNPPPLPCPLRPSITMKGIPHQNLKWQTNNALPPLRTSQW